MFEVCKTSLTQKQNNTFQKIMKEFQRAVHLEWGPVTECLETDTARDTPPSWMRGKKAKDCNGITFSSLTKTKKNPNSPILGIWGHDTPLFSLQHNLNAVPTNRILQVPVYNHPPDFLRWVLITSNLFTQVCGQSSYLTHLLWLEPQSTWWQQKRLFSQISMLYSDFLYDYKGDIITLLKRFHSTDIELLSKAPIPSTLVEMKNKHAVSVLISLQQYATKRHNYTVISQFPTKAIFFLIHSFSLCVPPKEVIL